MSLQGEEIKMRFNILMGLDIKWNRRVERR